MLWGHRRELIFEQVVPSLISPLDKMTANLADDIFRCIFVNEKFSILIKSSLKFVSKDPIDNIPVLVSITAWRRTGDKPLSEPMLTQFTDTHMRH